MAQKTHIPAELANFDCLPNSANVRIKTVMQLYGASAATVWRQSGKSIPAPRKLSDRITAWNVGELREAFAKKSGGDPIQHPECHCASSDQLATEIPTDQEMLLPSARIAGARRSQS